MNRILYLGRHVFPDGKTSLDWALNDNFWFVREGLWVSGELYVKLQIWCSNHRASMYVIFKGVTATQTRAWSMRKMWNNGLKISPEQIREIIFEGDTKWYQNMQQKALDAFIYELHSLGMSGSRKEFDEVMYGKFGDTRVNTFNPEGKAFFIDDPGKLKNLYGRFPEVSESDKMKHVNEFFDKLRKVPWNGYKSEPIKETSDLWENFIKGFLKTKINKMEKSVNFDIEVLNQGYVIKNKDGIRKALISDEAVFSILVDELKSLLRFRNPDVKNVSIKISVEENPQKITEA